ncbi:MAG TPA: oligogalacturonate lyase family protein [Opitutaceae bacterium]|nr:oligogalacturonate lyase family protein [Opitutaceae bacterium]
MKLPLALLFAGLALPAPAADLPRSWIDPDTGHRVVQLSTEPDSNSLYFTQYGYTDHGTRLIMTTPHGVDLVTVGTGATEHLLDTHAGRVIQAGRKSGKIFLIQDGWLCSLDPDTRALAKLVRLREGWSVSTINADETLAAGAITEQPESSAELRQYRRTQAHPAAPPEGGYRPGVPQPGHDDYPEKMDMMRNRLAQRLPMTLFTIDLRTGEVRKLYHSTDWLNHFQFSPTDPTLMSFCHEGPWWLVDRVWLLRVDGKSQPVLVHKRTMRMEIANHEVWSADGQWLCYDCETPMNEVFWVASYNVYTGERIWYHLTLDQWSIHYNRSPDGTLYSGDGGEPGHLGPQPPHSKWMYLFHPQMLPDEQPAPPAVPGQVRVGTFRTERLVNLKDHSYSLEPNGNFTPDGKWVVFRSNLRGPIQVYAVEVAKAR